MKTNFLFFLLSLFALNAVAEENPPNIVDMYRSCEECRVIALNVVEQWQHNCSVAVTVDDVFKMPAFRTALRSYFFHSYNEPKTASLVQCQPTVSQNPGELPSDASDHWASAARLSRVVLRTTPRLFAQLPQATSRLARRLSFLCLLSAELWD